MNDPNLVVVDQKRLDEIKGLYDLHNYVLERVKGMKEPSRSASDTCVYRDKKGSACLVGACISDETIANIPGGVGTLESTILLDRGSVASAVKKSLPNYVGNWNLLCVYLRACQLAHDGMRPEEWDVSRLTKQIGNAYHLVTQMPGVFKDSPMHGK